MSLPPGESVIFLRHSTTVGHVRGEALSGGAGPAFSMTGDDGGD